LSGDKGRFRDRIELSLVRRENSLFHGLRQLPPRFFSLPLALPKTGIKTARLQ
jgi:hypothetical protein